MEIPIWLQVSAAAVGLIGGSAGVFSSIYHALIVKRDRDESLRKDINRAWTNEGDISSTETNFITVELELTDGDIIGQISTYAYDRLLEAHVDIGWFTTTLTISELLGRSLAPVAVVRLKLKGNRNRHSWKVLSGNKQGWFPAKTVLWPSRVSVVDLRDTTQLTTTTPVVVARP